jgi:hypothetical protein
MRLQRDRRWGDRRASSVGNPTTRAPWLERRAGDRRAAGESDLIAAASEVVIEMEADYEVVTDDQICDDEPVTGIHDLVAPPTDDALPEPAEELALDRPLPTAAEG